MTLSATFDRHCKAWFIVDESGERYGLRQGYTKKSVALRIIRLYQKTLKPITGALADESI